MKKSYFFLAAASAIALTGCQSDDSLLAEQPKAAVEQVGVGFDVYVPNATNQTRAGLEGTMTTSRLQRSEQYGGGFGVYAYLTEDDKGAEGDVANTSATAYDGRKTAIAPNFMANEKLLWNTVNQGWYYNPLKYWPNETDYDSQNTPAWMQSDSKSDGKYNDMHLDRLTFFAYAPYVEKGILSEPGITYITNNKGRLTTGTDVTGQCNASGAVREASIGYAASLNDPNKAVDLLWGVAPAGGLTYTAVNGRTVNVPEGQPLIDMTKPNVNTNMKFLFQHALARLGVKVVAAIDQVGAGGTLDPNTRITINSVTITGYFGSTGFLNLDNTIANVANWTSINNVDLSNTTTLENLQKKTITISGETIAEHLRSATTSHNSPASELGHIGVTTVKQDLLEPSNSGDKTNGSNGPWVTGKEYKATELAYSETTPYYTDKECKTLATPEALAKTGRSERVYTLDSKGVYTAVSNTTNGITVKYPAAMQYFEGTFTLVTADNKDSYKNNMAYTKSTTGQINGGDTFTPKSDVPTAGDYVITEPMTKKVIYYPAGTYYKRDANYFMVVPTNNIKNIVTSIDEEKLRTVRVKIDYYITTEDGSLQAGRAQTKNVIEKDVLFPSLANGKSYNLNLILGLTSVKMEAEVDDWKVINVQGDLPQNTAE